MASLRYGTDNAPTAEWQAALDEQNRPNALRGGWESGRIGTERNALGIDEAAARSSGDTVRADSLRQQNDALAQAQGRVAPRVQRVEDIGSVGDFGNWFAGAAGQGVASMVEPLAAATTVGGAGALLGLAPGALGKVGRGLRNFGAPAAAFGINQRQLAGEFYNDAVQDPELMARTSAQDLNQTANLYGVGAGALDTVLPTIVGRQLTGAGLRAGIKGMGPGAKTALGTLGEGATETLQGIGSQQTQGYLNPNRDASGDLMDSVNNFAGGMAGGGPLSAAGAIADAGYRRAGHTAEQIGTKAGEMVDLAQERYEGSALQGGVDKAIGAGKQKAGDLIDLVRGDNGEVSLERLAELGRQGVDKVTEGATDLAERYKVSREEQDLLDMTAPPDLAADPEKHDAWFRQADADRSNFVARRLDAMAETDPVAADLLERLSTEQDPAAQQALFDQGADHILQNNELEQMVSRAERAASTAGEFAMQGAGALGRGAVAAGKAAAGFGKAVFDGAMSARKQNAQSNDAPAGYAAWRERTSRLANPVQDVRRAEMFGDMLATESAGKTPAVQQYMRSAGYELADMAQDWPATQGSKRPAAQGMDLAVGTLADKLRVGLGPRADAALAEMQALATPEAAPMFDRLRAAVTAGRTPAGRQQALDTRRSMANELMLMLPDARRSEIMGSEASKGQLSRAWLLDSVEALANGHQSPQFRGALEGAFGKDTVAQMLGHISLTGAQGGEYGTATDNATYSDEAALSEDGEYVGEGEATGTQGDSSASDFEQRQNEKMVGKGAAPKMYSFWRTEGQSVRSSSDRRDPFAPLKKPSKDSAEREADDLQQENAERRAKGLEPLTAAPVVRPNLFNASEAGQRHLDAQIEKMQASVGPRYMVSARTALEVVKDLEYPPAKVLSIYRDYLRQEAAREGTPLLKRKELREQANQANRALIDEMAGHGAEKNMAQMSRTQSRAAEATQKRIAAYEAKNGGGSLANLSPADRAGVLAAAEKYLGEHRIAVAEMVTNRDPGQIELGELVDFARSGERTWDFAMSGRSKEQGPDPEVIDGANLITFQSDAMGKKGDDRGMHIPASRLVGWVRAQRPHESAEESDKGSSKARDKNEAYLKDLLEGITAVMDSGMVDAKMPTRMNAKGQWESFGKNVHKSLQLETTTYGAMQFGKKQNPKASSELEPGSDEHQTAVAEDQAKHEEFFVAEPLEVIEPRPNGERQEKVTEEARNRVDGPAVKGKKADGVIRTDRSGTTYADPKTVRDDKTELDFAKKQKPGAVPDEYADQRHRSSVKKPGDGIGPEPKMSAMKLAQKRGDELMTTFHGDFPAGMEKLESRMRTAGRPTFVEGDVNALMGGAHYIAPLAHALSRANMELFDGDDRAYLDYKRAEVAGFILTSPDLTVPQKIELTRAMAPAASRAKITLGNFAKTLQSAAEKAPAVMAKAQPAAAPAPVTEASGQLQRALETHMEYLTNPPGDYTTERARSIAGWADRQLARIEEGMAQAEKGSELHESLADARAQAKRLVAKAAAVLEGDSSLSGFATGVDAAPEVANAGLPKGSASRRGADWSATGGRKLNAQDTGGQDGRRTKLITRLADDRRGAFSAARPDGVHRDASREVSFGPVRGAEEVFLLDQDYSHTFVIPRELADAARKKLSEYPTDRAADVLSIFAVQHATYHRKTGEFATFGPDPRGPAGRLLAQLGALGDTGRAFSHGVPMTRVEGVTDRQLAAFLGDALAYTKQVLGVSSLSVTWQRQTGSNIGKENEGIFNAQNPDGNARIASQAEMDEATAYVKKVLGPQIKVSFKDLTGYSGEWLDAEQAIEISTTSAAGALHTAYHEALHGFFSKFVKSDPRVRDTLKSLAENEKTMGRVAALLAQHPAALAQLQSGEERLAYIYQFWASGKLQLPMGKPRTLLQKVRKFLRATLGLVRDSERAVALFEAFHAGQLAEPSAAGRVIAKTLNEGTGILKLRRSVDGFAQGVAAKILPAETVLADSDSAEAKALGKEFFSNPGAGLSGQDAQGEGYLNARRHVASQYNNRLANIVRDLSGNDMAEVIAHLQAERDPADIAFAPHREAVEKTRALLQRFYRYMSDERGVELGHAGEKYFPRVWSTDALVGKQQEFTDMLLANYDAVLADGAKNGTTKAEVATRIWRGLLDRQGVNDKLAAQREDGVLAPFFASKENRSLAWLQGEHIEPFMEKNLVATMTRYFSQGARAAEYTSRFGKDGKDLERRLVQVKNELDEASFHRQKRGEFKTDKDRIAWARRQYRDVAESVGAMEGTLGKDISPGVRRASSWMMVYQNVRLLPMALFSSVVDPLGMVSRGASMKEAYDGFLRGMREVFGTWGDLLREQPRERQADEWEQLAEHVGAVDAAVFSNFVAEEYSSVYMERGAKKINDTMFKLNGMEAWNRAMRVAGVKSAVKFIERHVGGVDVHSARWLDELGLKAQDVPLDSSGKLITSKTVLMNEKGIGRAQAEREIEVVHTAINRWVEGAILTPNAAQRPAWSSDPHYSIFFHLKQFSYSFHQTLLKRAVNEMNHGNLAPLGAFAWYIPVMIGADIVKGLIQGGGELPGYMKVYDAGDWVLHGVDRSGALGIGALGVGAAEDPFSLLGPMTEQITDAFSAPGEKTLMKALPANALYAQALK